MALALAVTLDPVAALFPLFAIAGPAVWLSRLALLARPIDDTDPQSALEWYPAARLLLWAAGLAVGIALLGLVILQLIGQEAEAAYRNTLILAIDQFRLDNPDLLADADSAAMADVIMQMLPVIAATSWMIMLLANYVLARRVTTASGLCQRPPTPLAALSLPREAAYALGAVIVLSFLPIGFLASLASVATATLLIGFLLSGLGAIHAMTLGSSARGLILFALYASLIILGWVGLFVAIFGVIDTMIGLRNRNAPPPVPPSVTPGNDDRT